MEVKQFIEETNTCIRQYKYLYRKLLEEKTIRNAWRNLRKGKTKRTAVKKVEANFDNEVRMMIERFRNTKPEGCEVEHPELAYEPPKIRRTKIVNEYGKKRKAYLADIREQWYFHCIVEVLKPIILKHLDKGVCGCVPKRGPHSGKQMIERTIRDGKKVRNFIKCDVRHFYDNLHIDIILNEMRTYIADELFLYCIRKIYKYVNKGIMIGLYISPWLANFALMRLDHMISKNKDVAYWRYVDDIVVFCANKKTLRQLLVDIRKTLGKLRLRLKRNFQICRFDYETKKIRHTKSGRPYRLRIGRPLDFMGFAFYRDRTVIRKRIMIDAVRCAKKLKKAKDQGRRFYGKLTRAFMSRLGWFTATDSYNCYLKYIKPIIEVRKIKHIISKQDKEGNKHDRLEERNIIAAAA